jgi:hypothetical protein
MVDEWEDVDNEEDAMLRAGKNNQNAKMSFEMLRKKYADLQRDYGKLKHQHRTLEAKFRLTKNKKVSEKEEAGRRVGQRDINKAKSLMPGIYEAAVAKKMKIRKLQELEQGTH